MARARRVALHNAAAALVGGKVEWIDDHYLLDIELQNLSSDGRVSGVWRHSFSAGSKHELFDAVHSAAVWVRSKAGESARQIAEQDRPPEETASASWKALEMYAAAARSNSLGRNANALSLIGAALRADPKFAAAQIFHADILIAMQRYEEAYDAWRKAKQLEGQLPSSVLATEPAADWRSAEKEYRNATAAYPTDYHPTLLLAGLLENLGRTEESVKWFERAKSQNPNSITTLERLTTLSADLGRFSEAVREIEAIRSLNSDKATWLESWIEFSEGHPEAALRSANRLNDSEDATWRSRAYSARACWLSELGRVTEAVHELNNGVAFDVDYGFRASQANKLAQLAWLYFRQGDIVACRESCRSAYELDQSLNVAFSLGVMLSRIGDVNGAKPKLDLIKTLDQNGTHSAALRLMGEIALAQRHTSQAVAYLKEAVTLMPATYPHGDLAHALAEAGDLRGAIEIYKEIVQHRGRLYIDPEMAIPGSWSDYVSDLDTLVRKLRPTATQKSAR
jgi:tetratricopeptide (TPR) repeat protein